MVVAGHLVLVLIKSDVCALDHCISLQVPDFDLDQTELKRGWKVCHKCK